MTKKYEATFDSLYTYQCPEWFRDAKFGIWSHWGPQSVPMVGDWYARNMYIQGTKQYNYHLRHYGHPSEFGYKDICKLWKAEKFNPDGLMDLYYRAGARYFVAQAMHHDHFFNYKSSINKYNSVNIGPGKDICELWKQAADKYKMPFGLTEHLGASFSWWYVNKGADTYGPYKGVPYDGCDEKYKDYYFANEEHYQPGHKGELIKWMTENKDFQKYWLSVMKELTDKFHPALLYSDSALPFDKENYQPGLEAVSYLYNDSVSVNGENRAVYTQKERNRDVYRVGVLEIEKSQLPTIMEDAWQTDTCIGNWFYDAGETYKRPDQLVEMLVDIVSKNGNMLLNILQRPDGTIDEEAEYILKEMGKWFSVCAEGIYGTRPYRVFGEGTTRVLIDGFTENKTNWTEEDYRFTQKGNTVYAFLMKAPEKRTAVIKTLMPYENVKKIRLLGIGEIPFAQNYGIVTAKLPDKLPVEYANCLALEM